MKLLRVLCLLLCLALPLQACAEAFTLWNGVRFGMTRDEVELTETLPPASEDGTLYGPGLIFGVMNSEVSYTFTDDRLTAVTVSLHGRKSSKLIRADYDDVHKLLKKAYGKTLGKKDADAWPMNGPAWTAMLEAKKAWKTDGGRTRHEEWGVTTEDGRVKIDHFYAYMPGTTPVNLHVVDFAWFPPAGATATDLND